MYLLYFLVLLIAVLDPGAVDPNYDPRDVHATPQESNSPTSSYITTLQQPLPTTVHENPTKSSFCHHCERYKPPRTHHCRTCKTCILKMDHHCPWIGGCVGYEYVFLFPIYSMTNEWNMDIHRFKNQAHFTRFLIHVVLSCILALLLLMQPLGDLVRRLFFHESSYGVGSGVVVDGLGMTETQFAILGLDLVLLVPVSTLTFMMAWNHVQILHF
jgi:hypothetical protein